MRHAEGEIDVAGLVPSATGNHELNFAVTVDQRGQDREACLRDRY